MDRKSITMTVLVVTGLLYMSGSGCSDGDKGAEAQAAALRAQLDAKNAEMECKVRVLSQTCPDNDTACNDKKAAALLECAKLGIPGGGNTSTVTGTGTGTSTSTSTH